MDCREPLINFGTEIYNKKDVTLGLSAIQNILVFGSSKRELFFKNIVVDLTKNNLNNVQFILFDNYDGILEKIVDEKYILKTLDNNIAYRRITFEPRALQYLHKLIEKRASSLKKDGVELYEQFCAKYSKAPFSRIVVFLNYDYYHVGKEEFIWILNNCCQVGIHCICYIHQFAKSKVDENIFDSNFVNFFKTRAYYETDETHLFAKSFFDSIKCEDYQLINTYESRFLLSFCDTIKLLSLPNWTIYDDPYLRYFNDSCLSIAPSLDLCYPFILYSNYLCLKCDYKPYHFQNDECPICHHDTYISTVVGALFLDTIFSVSNEKIDISDEDIDKLFEKEEDIDDYEKGNASFTKDDIFPKSIRSFDKGYPKFDKSKRNKEEVALLVKVKIQRILKLKSDFLKKEDQEALNKLLNNQSYFDSIFEFYINEYDSTRLITTSLKTINRIEVRQLFGYSSFDIDFDTKKQLAILFGPNGFGKSTVFRLLECLLIDDEIGREKRINYLLNGVQYSSLKIMFSDGAFIEVSKKQNQAEIKYKQRNGYAYFDDIQPVVFKKNDDESLPVYNKQSADAHFKVIKMLFPMLSTYAKRFLFIKTNRVVTLPQICSYLKNNSKNDAQFDLLLSRLSKMSNVYGDILFEIDPKLKRPDYLDFFNKRLTFLNNRVTETYYYYKNLKDMQEGDDEVPITEEAMVIFNKIKECGLLFDYCGNLVFTEGDEFGEETGYSYLIEALWDLFDFYRKFVLFQEKFNSLYNKYSLDRKEIVLDGFNIKLRTSQKNIIEAENLSSGELNLLTILFELIFNTKNDSIVLIDEPEISLHLAWQQRFASLVQEIININNMQVIVASHSPFITSGDESLLVSPKRVKDSK